MKEEIFKMYRSISIGQNETCKECNENGELDLPLSIYFVGDKFNQLGDTILFVGKTAVGGEGIGTLINDQFYDVTEFGESSLDGTGHQSNFYSYTHRIIENYYGTYNEGKHYVALSNLVKCNNGSTKDKTTYETKKYCINELQVIWKEVGKLKPQRIIFYTGRDYDDFIDAFSPQAFHSYYDMADDEQLCWWHRRFLNSENRVICDFLRVYHPEYMRYNDENVGNEYVLRIVNWLKQTRMPPTVNE